MQEENKNLFYDALVEMQKSRQKDEEGFFAFTYNELCKTVHRGKDKVKNCLLQLATEGKISLKIGAGTARTKAKIIR